MPDEVSKKNNIFLSIIFLSCVAIIAFAFYSFYINRNFPFLVETQCDNTKEICFYRDCTVEGDCPQNNLSYFNKYTIKARDFDSCTNGDCTQACENKVISCEKAECTESDFADGSCVVQQIPEEIVPVANTEIINKSNKKK